MVYSDDVKSHVFKSSSVMQWPCDTRLLRSSFSLMNLRDINSFSSLLISESYSMSQFICEWDNYSSVPPCKKKIFHPFYVYAIHNCLAHEKVTILSKTDCGSRIKKNKKLFFKIVSNVLFIECQFRNTQKALKSFS